MLTIKYLVAVTGAIQHCDPNRNRIVKKRPDIRNWLSGASLQLMLCCSNNVMFVGHVVALLQMHVV